MGNQEKEADNKEADKIVYILMKVFKGIVIALALVLIPGQFFIQMRNDRKFSQKGFIDGKVVGKKIDINKKNFYFITVENTMKEYTFEIRNDSMFKIMEPGDFFIDKGPGDTCLLAKIFDTIAFDPHSKLVYSGTNTYK